MARIEDELTEVEVAHLKRARSRTGGYRMTWELVHVADVFGDWLFGRQMRCPHCRSAAVITTHPMWNFIGKHKDQDKAYRDCPLFQ